MEDPIATGYVAPVHGHGAMGFLLMALLGVLVLLAGALSPDPILLAAGTVACALAAAGFAWYWRTASGRALVRVYRDRLVFERGPQRGSLPFADVTGVSGLEWKRSFYPYQKAQRVLVLQTPTAEWQVGPEIAEHREIQEAVIRALNAWASRQGLA